MWRSEERFRREALVLVVILHLLSAALLYMVTVEVNSLQRVILLQILWAAAMLPFLFGTIGKWYVREGRRRQERLFRRSFERNPW